MVTAKRQFAPVYGSLSPMLVDHLRLTPEILNFHRQALVLGLLAGREPCRRPALCRDAGRRELV